MWSSVGREVMVRVFMFDVFLSVQSGDRVNLLLSLGLVVSSRFDGYLFQLSRIAAACSLVDVQTD
jgi:hypothetical protein